MQATGEMDRMMKSYQDAIIELRLEIAKLKARLQRYEEALVTIAELEDPEVNTLALIASQAISR